MPIVSAMIAAHRDRPAQVASVGQWPEIATASSVKSLPLLDLPSRMHAHTTIILI